MSVIAGAVWGIAWRVVRSRHIQERERLRRELRETAERLKEAEAIAVPERAELERSLAEARGELTQAQDDAERLRQRVDRLDHSMRIAHQMEGRSWRVRPTSGPAFVPLSERRLPIIPVLNLKGGVGKTTLAANLGAAYARMGWRVLLVDLDLQASLTHLFFSGEEIQQTAQAQRFCVTSSTPVPSRACSCSAAPIPSLTPRCSSQCVGY